MATYAMSDIHGEYKLLEIVLRTLKEDDTLIFLGDAVDRGPDSVRCLTALLADSRVIYLKGNHEVFFRKTIGAILNEEQEQSEWLQAWAKNGGKTTLTQLKDYSDDEIIEMLYAIDRMPLCAEYTNDAGQVFHLSHAGTTPEYTEEEDLLWDRDHFEDSWYAEENMYVVHGHTPVCHICDVIDDWVALQYCDGHKINIDLAAFYSKRTCLFNLDNFSVTYFEIDYEGDVYWWRGFSPYCTDKVHNPKKEE